MTRKKRPGLTLIHANGASAIGAVEDSLTFLEEMELDLRGEILSSQAVIRRIDRIVAAVNEYDALELLGQLRVNDIGSLMMGTPESARPLEQSHAVTELLAAVVLALGLRRSPDQQPGKAAEAIAAIRADGAWLLRAAQFDAAAQEMRASSADERLTARHIAGHLSARGWQYPSIARRTVDDFLTREPVPTLIESHYGFTPSDVDAVARALYELQDERLHAAMDRLRMAAESTAPATKETWEEAMVLLLRPQEVLSLTVLDVASVSGVDTTKVSAILSLFSVSVPEGDPRGVVLSILRGQSPFFSKGLVRVSEDEFIPLGTAMLTESLRPVLENGLPRNTPLWARYDKARARWAEREAARLIAASLGVEAPTHRGLRYLASDADGDVAALGPAGPPPRTSKQVEADAVFVVDGVAFCVEVKAGALSPRARGGDRRRLMKDLDQLVRSANEQADRLRALITAHGGVWSAKRQWISFAGVREVRSIVVTLDDCGAVLLSMRHLVEAGLVATEQVPWIVSLHDLHVTNEILGWPAQFLAYVRRRTHAEATKWLQSVDELDYLMAFADGLLFFEDDPDRPRRLNGAASGVGQRRRHERQGPTLIGTLTDELDNWYDAQHRGEGDVPKPARDEGPFVTWFLENATRQREPGWLRFGAVLVGLDTPTRAQLLADQSKVASAAKRRQFKSVTRAGEDEVNAWLFAVSTDVGASSFAAYLAAKKHQLHADLACGLMFDAEGSSLVPLFLDGEWHHDRDADALVARMVAARRLRVPERSPSAIPPSASRTTKRLRGRRKSSRHR